MILFVKERWLLKLQIELTVKVKVPQSYLTLCNPTGYTVCGIFQPEYWSGSVSQSVQSLSHVQLFVTPWSVASL